MFFSNKPQLLIYLHREGLSVFGKVEANFKFAEGVIQNLEVSDESLLHESLHNFLASLQIDKTTAICLLDDDIIFQKIMPLNGQADIKSIQQQYASVVPFEPEKVSVISLITGAQLVLIAANKGFYLPVVKTFGELGCKVEIIAPMAVFGKGKLDQKSAETILNDSKRAEKTNFYRLVD